MSIKETLSTTRGVLGLSAFVLSSMFNRPDPDALDNVALRLSNTATLYPDKTAIVFEGQSVTWSELDNSVSQVAQALIDEGVKPDDSVSLLVENSIVLIETLFGCLRAGARVALINTNLRGLQLIHCMQTTQATKLIFDAGLADAVAEVKSECDLTEGNDFLCVGEQEPSANWYTNFSELYSKAEPIASNSIPPVKRDQLCLYLFTSGTTGMPKAAVQYQSKLLGSMDSSTRLGMKWRNDDRLYLCLPLYHATGLILGLAPAIQTGATVFLRRKFSASHFLDEIREHNCNAFVYIGELCRYLLAQPVRENDQDNPLTKIVGNGLRPDIWMEFKQRFNIHTIFEFYAASEGNTGFMNLFNRDCTIGTALSPPVLIEYNAHDDEIVRGEGGFCQRVNPGEPGLLLGRITKRTAFEGYTDEEATEKKVLRNVFEEGDAYFNTGDLIKKIDSGFAFGFKHYQFVDRVGDTFRWKGENCSTNEIGEIINSHPCVQVCNVYGVQIPGTDGRAGMAAILLMPDVAFDIEGISKLIQHDLASFARPVFIRLLTEVQLTGTFKMQKGDLRDEAYHLDKVSDPIYVLKPGSTEYTLLDAEDYQDILDGNVNY